MEEVKYKISPKFNFIYEITMPLGAKLRRSLIMIFVFIVAMIAVSFGKSKVGLEAVFFNMNAMEILYWICLFFLIIFVLKFIIDLALKIMQYKRITYSFYSDKVIYEDTFLNQQRKVVKYENIKEIEIRRTVWDRLMGYGIIIISTNAEGKHNSGLIIYGINNPNEIYDKINGLVDECNKENKYIKNYTAGEVKEEKNESQDVKIKQDEEEQKNFKDSLKNIK